MDQQELRELERRCIQEEPTFCTAACPLHVDARAFVGRAGHGDWDSALKILFRFMPLPGILGRICDAPCERKCRRAEAGDAIAIGAIERVCVEMIQSLPKTMPLPSKGKRVAVAGGGLSSLTVAWDLYRKGYHVTVFEPGDIPASILYSLEPSRLPAEAIQKEIARLLESGVVIECNVTVAAPEIWDRWMTAFDAVYLGLDGVSSESWDLPLDDTGEVMAEQGTQRTVRKNVFAGGRSGQSIASPVFKAAEGRWAAVSIDRFLQGVSITAGREKEGPCQTRLFTSLKGISPSSRQPMTNPARGYSRKEAEKEAGRCLSCECLECVKVCAYLEEFKSYPRKYAREIYNNAAIVMGEHKANRLINSCSLCGLCERVCPNGFAMQDLCLSARKEMTAKGRMPPSAYEFALLDLAFSRSDRFSLVRHQPGKVSSHWVFFPGCQWAASAPDQVERTYSHLCEALRSGVGLILGCCGAPALWAGDQALFSETLHEFETQWSSLGASRLVIACSTCYGVFKEHLPKIPVTSLWEVMEGTLTPDINTRIKTAALAIHDPCTTRDEAGIRQAVRRILKHLGVETLELDLSGELTECCGYGGLMQAANPDLALKVTIRRSERSPLDYLAYCAVCRDNLAKTGKRAFYIMDLIFPDESWSDPAARPRPGWSERRENRTRLKERLMCRLWNEKISPDNSHKSIRIIMSPEITNLLEKRRILMEDIQQTIIHAETTGKKLVHHRSGRFKAAYTPRNVTFWVEYSPVSDGFQIHNAYSHRMEVSVS